MYLNKVQSEAQLWQQLIKGVLVMTSGEDLRGIRVQKAKVHIEAEGWSYCLGYTTKNYPSEADFSWEYDNES